MRLITTKQALVDCLGIVSKAVSSRTSIQVLSGVLLEATDEGIVLSATDMEISIRAPLAGRVERPGSLVVPARIAADIARSLPVGEVILEQSPGETQVEIRAAGSVFDLHSLPAADFPQLPACIGDRFHGRQGRLRRDGRPRSSLCLRDETRPVLTGVLIHFTKTLCAHGRHRQLPTQRQRDPTRSPLSPTPIEVIIPARTLLELSRIAAARRDETISILPTENQILFEVGGISLVSRLIDGQFPNYRQLIPETFDHEVAVDHDELLEAVRRVGLLAQKNTPLRMRFSDNTLSVSAESQDVGKANETMPGAVLGRGPRDRFQPGVPRGGRRLGQGTGRLSALHQPSAPRAWSRVPGTTSCTWSCPSG